jgi:hypothetical protein
MSGVAEAARPSFRVVGLKHLKTQVQLNTLQPVRTQPVTPPSNETSPTHFPCGDVVYAFEWDEWDIMMPTDGSFFVSVDKPIRPIPLPPSVFLLGSGLIGLVGLGRLKKS